METHGSMEVSLNAHHRPVARLRQSGAFDEVGTLTMEVHDKAKETDDDSREP